MILNISLVSKNRQSIKKFLAILKKYDRTIYKFMYGINLKKKKKTLYTLLKSPHVHKTTREQLTILKLHYKLQFNKLIPLEKLLFFFKSLQNKLLTEINFKYSIRLNQYFKYLAIDQKKISEKFFLNKFILVKKYLCLNLLKLFEIYGKMTYLL